MSPSPLNHGPEFARSLPELDFSGISYALSPANQPPPTPRYAVLSWEDALASHFHGWDPRIYSDPLVCTPAGLEPFFANEFYDPSLAAFPPMHAEGPSAEWPAAHERQAKAEELPPPGTHSSASVLLHQPFPHHQNDGSWFASRGGTPVGNHSFGVELYSSAPSSPTPVDAGTATPTPRTRPAIALDPTQPLRVDGKPRERVYAACERCRVRKLRCDGAQPTCYNCNKAKDKGVKCVYPVSPPKRRGADKGQRIRSPIGQRQPRKGVAGGTGKRRERGGDVGASGDSATEGSSSVPGTPDD
ncbi:hypothetical protein BD309DRAFT_976756 [Dichomitus squalens]|nr:hypothetical protein BD309DRAFT_976756 [Dichomitus squalens]